jgi:hypothetical protein
LRIAAGLDERFGLLATVEDLTCREKSGISGETGEEHPSRRNKNAS